MFAVPAAAVPACGLTEHCMQRACFLTNLRLAALTVHRGRQGRCSQPSCLLCAWRLHWVQMAPTACSRVASLSVC